MPVLLSYRNQSIDLQSKSIDWFLYLATLAFNELSINIMITLDMRIIFRINTRLS